MKRFLRIKNFKLNAVGMKTNNMSKIENSLLVTLRLLDPLKMLLQLVLKASQELAKAQQSCKLEQPPR